MDITTDGSLTYARGYGFIMAGNILYLVYRSIFRQILNRNYEQSERVVYPKLIVTIRKLRKQERETKYFWLKCFFPVFVWSLTVGFINIWRGLFATFDYCVELLHKDGVNKVISSILIVIIVAITLRFTLTTNSINLCPTHKMYKYDEMKYLDPVFFVDIFPGFQIDEEVQENEEKGKVEEKYKEETNYILCNNNVEMVEFSATKAINSLHEPKISRNVLPVTWNNIVLNDSVKEEQNNESITYCRNSWRCRCIRVLTYLGLIHYRYVFLQIFGGAFWSSIWRIYDMITESFFNKTSNDLPGLFLIAFACHCLNHLVIFSFKEHATGVYWKTLWESVCGINTVLFWASIWYVWDILSSISGKET